MRARLLLVLLFTSALAACLGACGGGGSSSSAPAASSTTSASTPAGPATTSASPPPPTTKSQTPVSAAKTAAERRVAAHAAPFIEPEADNSIPTFGSESSGSDRAGAGAALRAYLSARAEGEWAAACTGLATALRRQTQAFAGASARAKGCPAVYQALAAATPATARADPLRGPLLALRIKGASAFALFNGPHNQQYVMPMAREGGAWKVTQLAPIAYPLGSETPTSP